MNAFDMIRQMMDDHQSFDVQTKPGPGIPLPLKDAASSAERILLPPLKTDGEPLQAVLEQRTAVKFYSPASVDLADLGTILAAASRGDERDFAEANELGIGLKLYAIVWNVDLLAGPCIYLYEPRDHALRSIGPVPAHEEADALTLQREFTYAPVILLATGSLGASLNLHGTHGYRQLLVRGGAAMHRAWLASLSLGYAGSIFAGLFHRPLRELMQIDGYSELQLLAYAFGRPLQTD